MIGQPAKVLRPADVRSGLAWASQRRHGRRNKVILLLSVRAGLRAGEIAALRWNMVLDSAGEVGRIIELPARSAKHRSGRRIPMHPDLRQAMISLGGQREVDSPVIQSERGGRMSAKSIVNWFHGLYQALGLEGCSSHSGRRTFITQAARLVHKAGGSLRDVQELAGHRSIKTTQGYIEGDAAAQRKLINLL
jgi:integrase/recombinase XerD